MPTLGHHLGFLFSGTSSFYVDYAEYLSGKIYITYSLPPKATDPTATNDALNPANYTLAGSILNDVTSVAATADPSVYELTIRYPLTIGYWAVTASTLISNASLTGLLTSPDSYVFLVSSVYVPETASLGAENIGEDILSQFLNPAYAGLENWTKLMETLSVGEVFVRDAAQNAYDQLHLSSAGGKYLTQRAGDRGFSRFADVGLTDDNFRKYAIQVSNRQLTEESVLSVLEVFYGQDAVRAHAASALSQPYNIPDGYELDILVDERQSIKVVFADSDFGLPGYGTAIEVAGAITRWLEANGSLAYAVPWVDPETGLTYVKIYSGGLGLRSSVRITGGLAQESLNFPSKISVYTGAALPQWTVTYDSVTQKTKWTAQGAGLAVNPNLHLVKIGDYVNITGSEFNVANNGSFSITDLGVYYTFDATPQTVLWFEYADEGVSEVITQLAEASVSFYSPARQDSFTDATNSVIVADVGESLDVVLPATSPAVSRQPLRAAYLTDPVSFAIDSFSIKDGVATLTTATPMTVDRNVDTGDMVLLEGLVPALTVPTINPESPGISATSQVTVWSATDNFAMSQFVYGFATKISDTQLLAGYGLDISGSTVTLNPDWEDVDITTASGLGLRQSTYTLTGGVPSSGLAKAHCGAIKYGADWDILLGEPGVFVTGGWNATAGIYSGTSSSEFYLANSKTDLLNGDTSGVPHAGHTVAQTSSRGYVFGGMGADWQNTTTDVEYYDLAASSWFTMSSMSTGRFEAAMSSSSTDRYMITGGRPLAFGPKVKGDTVAIWKLDDSTAAPAGTGPHGSVLAGTDTNFVTAAPTSYNANSKNALAFPLSTSRATGTPTAELITALTSRNYTVEGMWRYQAALPQNAFFAVTATGAGTVNNTIFGFGPSYSATTKWGIWWEDATEARVLRESSATIVASVYREWNHWAVVVSPDTAADEVVVKLYINGTMYQSWSGVKSASGGANCIISVDRDLNAGYGATACRAGLGQIRVSNRAFSDSDVWEAYTQSTGEVLWNVPSTYSPNVSAFDRIGYVHNTTEIYDMVGNSWTAGPPMTYARFGHCQVTLPSGEILVVGGLGYNPTQFKLATVPAILRDCEIWSPVTNRWRPAGRLPAGAGGFLAVDFAGDYLYAVGSIDGYAYKYDLNSKVWSRAGAKNTSSTTFRKGAILNDVFLAAGGAGITGATSAATLDLLVLNSSAYYQRGTEGLYKVLTGGAGSTITVSSPDLPDYSTGTGGSVLALKAPTKAAGKAVGPFVLDPKSGLAFTSYSSTLTQDLALGHTYSQIGVADATNWPDSGYLIFGFGTKDQIGPVKYYTKINNTTLVVDAKYAMTANLATGATVEYLSTNQPYNPDSGLDLGVFYLTDSPSGRAAAQQTVQDITAAGVTVNIDVAYPSDRGLGAEGYPTKGTGKLSDVVEAYSHPDSLEID